MELRQLQITDTKRNPVVINGVFDDPLRLNLEDVVKSYTNIKGTEEKRKPHRRGNELRNTVHLWPLLFDFTFSYNFGLLESGVLLIWFVRILLPFLVTIIKDAECFESPEYF